MIHAMFPLLAPLASTMSLALAPFASSTFLALAPLASSTSVPAAEPVVVASAAIAGVEATWTVPKVYVEGHAFNVHVEVTAPKSGEIPAWIFETAAFTLDGQPIGEKKSKETLKSEAGSKIMLDVDLHEAISASKAFGKKDFKLDLPGTGVTAAQVRYLVPVEKGVEFTDEKKVPAESLSSYYVLLETNRGNMIAEFWPDVAPKHVRNYLDLCETGFYDGTLFHRVGPGFMIQGGDPNTKDPSKKGSWGTGNGPRTVNAEFNAKKHVRGVLSMARSGDPNSASCQFFVMHGPYPSLDGKYSAFGALIDGLETLDKIATAQGVAGGDGTVRPNEPQRIDKAVVLQAPPTKK